MFLPSDMYMSLKPVPLGNWGRLGTSARDRASTPRSCKYPDTRSRTRRYLQKRLGFRVGASRSGPGTYNDVRGIAGKGVQWGQCGPGAHGYIYKYLCGQFFEHLTPGLGLVGKPRRERRGGERRNKGWDCWYHCSRGGRLGLFEPPRVSGAEQPGGTSTCIETVLTGKSTWVKECYVRSGFHAIFRSVEASS